MLFRLLRVRPRTAPPASLPRSIRPFRCTRSRLISAAVVAIPHTPSRSTAQPTFTSRAIQARATFPLPTLFNQRSETRLAATPSSQNSLPEARLLIRLSSAVTAQTPVARLPLTQRGRLTLPVRHHQQTSPR